MNRRSDWKFLGLVMACLALQAANLTAAGRAHAKDLAASQLITPADMTPVELDYYNRATDPQVKKNFLITRSYVRIARKVANKELPPDALPERKPDGFSVQYLLPDEPTVLNQAMGLLAAKLMKKCFEPKAPGCR